MGAGSSATAGVKASISSASADDLRAAFATLSGEEKAKVVTALDSRRTTAAGMVKLLENRDSWSANGARHAGWLDKTQEEVLEPDLEIVDAHHHIWDMRELKGFNMFGMFKQQYYMTDELINDFIGGGHNVTHSVFATTHAFFNADAQPEWMAPLGEVQFVQGIAAQFASGKYGPARCAAGIIGTADLAKHGATVEPLLEACKTASPNFRGIRCNAAHDPKLPKSNFHPTAGMYAEPKFREGFALLEKHGLVFDAFVFACQLPEVYDLAISFPDTTIVLNHIGTPVAALGDVAGAPEYNGKQAEIIASWKVSMGKLAAECPNVYVKLGGAVIPQLGSGLDEREKPPSSEEVKALVGPMLIWTIQTFGAARCMLESNFPVDKVSVSYTVLWNAYKRITRDAGLAADDRMLLFRGTAKRVYRLCD